MGITRLKSKCQEHYIPSEELEQNPCSLFQILLLATDIPQLWPSSGNLIIQISASFLISSLTLSFLPFLFLYEYPFDHIGLTEIIHYTLPSQDLSFIISAKSLCRESLTYSQIPGIRARTSLAVIVLPTTKTLTEPDSHRCDNLQHCCHCSPDFCWI